MAPGDRAALGPLLLPRGPTSTTHEWGHILNLLRAFQSLPIRKPFLVALEGACLPP